MPTKNPRINITFDEDLATLLFELAQKNHRSVSSLAKELIIEALDRREDMALSALAESRDHKLAKRIKHEDAWK